SFENALSRLRRSLAQRRNEFVRDSAIKRFEFTFELFWKCLQTYCAFQGIECNSPRESIQQAFRLKVLVNDTTYLEMLEDRNLSSHSYNEEVAKEIYSRLKRYSDAMETVIKNIKKSLEE
ncbi:MAG: HI0074 family nucleotidyltransferase substrate-binding subunit, partial [Bacteroidota bacterium]